MKPCLLALLMAIGLSMTQGCMSMQAPTLLEVGKDMETPPQVTLSDWHIVRFGEALVKWWGARAVKTEAFGTGAGIALDAITTAALVTTGTGVSGDIARGLVGGVNFISSLIRRIDPAARDNAFNEGSGIVLDAQGQYAKCITQGGNAVPSTTAVTPCGAKFLIKANSAVRIVGNLMAGLLPQKTDLDEVTR